MATHLFWEEVHAGPIPVIPTQTPECVQGAQFRIHSSQVQQPPEAVGYGYFDKLSFYLRGLVRFQYTSGSYFKQL